MPYLGRTPTPSPVTADDIPDNSIDASKIKDGVITVDDLKDGSVSSAKLATAVSDDIAKGPSALPKAGGTMTGTIASFTSTGIDDNATSTAITIDASENIGINQPVPVRALHVKGSGSLNVALIENGGSSTSTLAFQNTGSFSNNSVRIGSTNNDFTISTNGGGAGSVRFTVEDTGDVKLQTGNLVIGTAGKGIDFGNWTITESSGVLKFATGGTNKMKLDASGNLTCVGDVTASGTI